jgi:hypothetical protein
MEECLYQGLGLWLGWLWKGLGACPDVKRIVFCEDDQGSGCLLDMYNLASSMDAEYESYWTYCMFLYV